DGHEGPPSIPARPGQRAFPAVRAPGSSTTSERTLQAPDLPPAALEQVEDAREEPARLLRATQRVELKRALELERHRERGRGQAHAVEVAGVAAVARRQRGIYHRLADEGRAGAVGVLALANDPDRVPGARLGFDLAGIAVGGRYLVTHLGEVRIKPGQLVPRGEDALQVGGRRFPGVALAVRLVE